jgi:signal transduction histidine kinase
MQENSSLSKGNILIVEDERVVALHLQDQIEKLGFQVNGMVASGEEALRQIEGKKPDLVLMDVKLKGTMDGVETAALLRTQWKVPVIYLTAYADEPTLERAKVTEPLGYLMKPFTHRDLRVTIDLALSKHRLEMERQELEAERRQVQKMEALGTLAGGIAHDLNNLLSAILGNSELAKTKLSSTSTAQGNLQEILTAGNRARELVKQILSFSRKVEPRVQPVQLASIIEETLRLLRATLPTSIAIQTHLNPGLRPILGDPTQIQQVLLNLCTNAEYAMREKGGLLEIGLERVDLQPKTGMLGLQLQPGTYQCIKVRDTGSGIRSEILENIFEPFFTTKDIGEGTGMGLAVTQGVLSKHGGGIAVESKPDHGAIFSIYFPDVDVNTCSQNKENQVLPKGKGRVFLIEDEKSVAKMGKEMLEELGYEVIVSTNSMAALEIFRRDPSLYDLVMTDQTMPELTGERLACELLKIRQGLPIILCTGFSHTVTAERAKALGIRGYLTKPYSMQDLALAFHEAMKP